MNGRVQPLVCVCLPTYNSAATVSETLASITRQTYKNIRIVVVDNASEDGTLVIVREYAKKDGRISVFVNEKNLGLEGNTNRCIQLAVGEYTAIYHSDDIYESSIIEEEVAALEARPDAAAVFAMARSFGSGGRPCRDYRLPLTLPKGEVYTFRDVFKAMLQYGNFLFCPTAMVRTDVYKNYVREWDYAKYISAADGDAWLRILKRYPVCLIDKPLLNYRLSVASFSYQLARKKTGRHDMFKLFDDYIQGYARDLIDGKDLINYAFLRLQDDVNRAFNLFVLGDFPGARELLAGSFEAGNIYNSLFSMGRLKIILSGYAVYVLSFIKLPRSTREYLMSARYKG
ncbi:MAG: hypothetical protein A2234_04105 [Elusimicrobia bacterium RIFOXYA2_FULL_58_8]|nr:MAG: hypothetical protein A2285_08125 [Elusimicrobia bacterium RIFOXYA12_FULL_57_11]OGS15457.1 MAG: hypothetical protein A2234_04105 [Elusimicrobia bacterium RIFOXYA2_FULL_58_8]